MLFDILDCWPHPCLACFAAEVRRRYCNDGSCKICTVTHTCEGNHSAAKSTVRTTHALQKPSLLIFEKSFAGLLFYPLNNSLDELMATMASRIFSHKVYRILKVQEMEKQ
jgi:hypothetical protein